MGPAAPKRSSYLSKDELRGLLGPYVNESQITDLVNNLVVDRRTSYGRQAGRLLTDQATDRDKYLGNQNSGLYYRPQGNEQTDTLYNLTRPLEYPNSQTVTPEQIDVALGDAVAFNVTEIPTSSTNYQRPRTVAAGYDPYRQVMTVVFRDGTFYNYYEVTQGEWNSFHASYSKGSPWLNKANSKQGGDGLFINKPRGDAGDLQNMNPQIREALYRVARTQQQKAPTKPGRTTQTAKLTKTTATGKIRSSGTMIVRNQSKSYGKPKPHRP